MYPLGSASFFCLRIVPPPLASPLVSPSLNPQMGVFPKGICGIAMMPSYPIKNESNPDPPSPRPKPPRPSPGPDPGPSPSPDDPVACNAFFSCPAKNSCCCKLTIPISDKQLCLNYGCCELEDAVCCKGGASCCPSNSACTDDGSCTQGPTYLLFRPSPILMSDSLSDSGRPRAPSAPSESVRRTPAVPMSPATNSVSMYVERMRHTAAEVTAGIRAAAWEAAREVREKREMDERLRAAADATEPRDPQAGGD